MLSITRVYHIRSVKLVIALISYFGTGFCRGGAFAPLPYRRTIVIVAVADFDGSTVLTAVSVTVDGDGTAMGAV